MQQTLKPYIRILACILMSTTLASCATTPAEKKALADQKNLVDVNLELGMAYLGKKDYSRAKRKLLMALEHGPKSPEAWYSMGYYLQKIGNNEKAAQYYEHALTLAPQRGDVQNNYGAFLCSIGKNKEAIQHFRLAVKDETYLDSASAYENAGLCSYKNHNLKAAKHYFRMALRQDPSRNTAKAMLSKLDARKTS